MKKRIILITCFIFIMSFFVGCSNQDSYSVSEDKKKIVTMVFPVTVDALVDFRTNAAADLIASGYEVFWFSAEGDPSRFSSTVKAALLKKPDILVSFGTQMTDAIFSSQFSSELPFVVASCISAPEKVESLTKIGIDPPRSRPVAILSDSPKQDIYSYSTYVIKEVVGKDAVVGLLYNNSELNSKNTARSLMNALEKSEIKSLEGIVSGEEDVTRVAKILISKGASIIVIPHDKYVIKKAGALVKLGLEQTKPIPVFSLDDGSVRSKGAAFGVSVSYGNLGKLTADTCKKIFAGNPPGKMPVIAEEAAQLFVNNTSMKSCGLTLSPELAQKAIVFKE